MFTVYIGVVKCLNTPLENNEKTKKCIYDTFLYNVFINLLDLLKSKIG